MTVKAHSVPPSGLGRAGGALWRALHRELPTTDDGDRWRFDERELAVLAMACAQRDEIAQLERVLAKHGPLGVGSKGQPRLSSVLAELRQARLACARLLGDLGLPPAEGDAKVTAASARGRKAAAARWSRVASLQERREAGRHRGTA